MVYHDAKLPFCYGRYDSKAWHFRFESFQELCEFIEKQRDKLVAVMNSLEAHVLFDGAFERINF